MSDSLIIDDKKVVSLSYTLTDKLGTVIDRATAEEPFVYLHGANNIILGLEKALTSKTAGYKFDIVVESNDAYGSYDDLLIQVVPKDIFEEIEEKYMVAGTQFQAQANGGVQIVTILEVNEDTLKVDGNHPLAGQDLYFKGVVLDVRAASEEELLHGHSHAKGGCEAALA